MSRLMAEGLLLAKDAGEELFKVVGLLVFALIAGVFQWLKARGEKRARQADVDDDESDAPARPAARPVAMSGPNAPGPVPLDDLVRRSAELDRPQPRRETKAERRARAEQARRLAQALQKNVALQRGRDAVLPQPAAPPRPKRPPMIGSLDGPSLRRAIIMNEILGPPVALRERPW